MIEFGSDWCRNFDSSGKHEWLVTNDIGGYASGTVAGHLSRRYHGLLIAALNPPLGRTLLVSNFEEILTYQGEEIRLDTQQLASGEIQPRGFSHLERFHLEGSIPVWRYSFADVKLDKRIWMQSGKNTTFIRYTVTRASKPIQIRIRPLVNYRDHHSENQVGDWNPRIDFHKHGFRITPSINSDPYFLFSHNAHFDIDPAWHKGFFFAIEAYRGLPDHEDLFSPGEFTAHLHSGDSFTIVASTQEQDPMDRETAFIQRKKEDLKIISKNGQSVEPDWLKQLLLAADQFIVDRPLPGTPDGKTIIAGYPWFGDWGRDTMISLPGLTLSTGRESIARSILMTFAQYIDRGMLPNNFPEIGENPAYNTVDATLWYFESIRAYHTHTGDNVLLAELYPILQEIIEWHQRGTRYSIHIDPMDGLIYAGEDDVQLTWMDAKVDDWVVTPRTGKPVEINALWYNALRIMESFADQLGKSSQPYRDAADQTKNGFKRFWNDRGEYCFDVLAGPLGDDDSLRPNQLFAVSLNYSPLKSHQRRAVVDVCTQHLLTPYGLRSLAPFQTFGDPNPDYIGTYGGDRQKRDAAYHQGTVWGWLIGPFISAHLRVYNDPHTAMNYLLPAIEQLSYHGVGSIGEIFDGDPPFTPRGCIAQAWSVAEIIRAWTEIKRYSS